MSFSINSLKSKLGGIIVGKKFLSLMVVFSLVVAMMTPFSQSVNAETKKGDRIDSSKNLYESAVEGETTVNDSKEVRDDNGELLRVIETSTLKKVIKNKKKEQVIIKLKITNKIFDADGRHIDTSVENENIKFNKDGELLINGQDVPESELSSLIIPSSISGNISTYSTSSSGGKKWLTYYYRGSSKSRYYLKAYKTPTNAFLDGGSGTPRTRYSYMNYKVSNFNALARSVASERNQIVAASAALAGAIGTAVLTWWSVIGALTSAGTAGVAAVTIYSSSKSAKSYMKEAYYQLGSI